MPRGHGRDPKRERFWRRTIKTWARSGETIRGFCARRGLTETGFHAWRRELRKRDGEVSGAAARRSPSRGVARRGRSARVRFLPVRIAAAGSTGPAAMEIERGGTTVRLRGAVDREILAQVLESLHRTSC